MNLTTKKDEILEDYYKNRRIVPPCKTSTKTRWYRISPYDWEESIYWGFKHIALPGIGILIIGILLIIRLYGDLVRESVVYILVILAVVFIASYVREYLRANIYRIPAKDYGISVKEIDVTYDYPNEDREKLFKIPLNTITGPKFKIGFVGDIMKLKKYNLDFDPEIVDFFKGVDIIVGNFEGVITNKRGMIPKQKFNNPPILDDLKKLLTDSTTWLLCISNNHSIDFSNEEFQRSLNIIQNDPQFNVFGCNDVPNVLIKEVPINISTASEWSNQKSWDCISIYNNDKVNSYYCPGKFNILFPHWGYENEKYVRTRLQSDAIAILTGIPQKHSRFKSFVIKIFNLEIYSKEGKSWDFIFGHHPHVRQPIMEVKDYVRDDDGKIIKNDAEKQIELNKLVVFSGGNFTSGASIIRKKKHIYGIIMKGEIGPLKHYPQKYAMSNVEWRRTVNTKDVDTKIVSIDWDKYRTYNLWALILGIALSLMTVLAFIFNLIIP
jgi:hypothetical protein